MNKVKILPALILLSFAVFSNGATTPSNPVRFAPATIGSIKHEIFSFMRFGMVPVGLELSSAERRALVELVKAKDSAGLIANSGLDVGQQFSLSLSPNQQLKYKTLAPKLLEKIVACIRAMPEDSGLALLQTISGMERLKDLRVIAKMTADFDSAVAQKCAATVNDLPTKPFEERALAGVESLLTGDISILIGGENYIVILQNLGGSIFGKPNAIFGEVAYDYLKATMTATVTGMGKVDGITLLTRPDGFSTFIDFLVVAKTKTSMPNTVIEAISDKCLTTLPDIFKPFSLAVCGSDTYTLRTLAIGEIEGTLVSIGAGS